MDPHVSPTIFHQGACVVPISNPSPSSTAAIGCAWYVFYSFYSLVAVLTSCRSAAATERTQMKIFIIRLKLSPAGGCAVNQSPTVCVCSCKNMRRVYRFLSQILRIMDIPHNLAISNPLSYVCARDHIRVAVSMEGNDGPVVCKPKRQIS
jgi:hypothetical protein